MNENNNTPEHTSAERSNNLAHNDAGATKDNNASRDGGEASSSTTSSEQSQGGYRRHGQDEQTSSHFPRRNNTQGFQRNNAASGHKRGGSYRSFRKEKYDKIAAEKLVIDYKQPDILKRFLTEGGKIFSRYVTGNSAKNQRRLVREVKRARFIGLLPSA